MVFNIDVAIAAGGGGGGAPTHRVFFAQDNGNAPTLGQTNFTLAPTPTTPAAVIAILNGVEYPEGPEFGNIFLVVGSAVTWNGPPTLGPTDDLEFIY